MIISNNLAQRTYYDILGVKEDASYEEIRSNYRSSILSSHPDKLLKECGTFNSNHESTNRFIELQQAWEILSNPRDRAMYDIELQASRKDVLTAEDVNLEDFTVEEAGESLELSYSCRCGDYFAIEIAELIEAGYTMSKNGSTIILQSTKSSPTSVILPCGSCSHKILLSINVNAILHVDVHL